MTMNGLVVSTPARTWRDLAGVLDLPSLVAAGDSVLRCGTSIDELADVINRTLRARYVRTARMAVPLLDGGPDRVPRVTSGLPSALPTYPASRSTPP